MNNLLTQTSQIKQVITLGHNSKSNSSSDKIIMKKMLQEKLSNLVKNYMIVILNNIQQFINITKMKWVWINIISDKIWVHQAIEYNLPEIKVLTEALSIETRESRKSAIEVRNLKANWKTKEERSSNWAERIDWILSADTELNPQ